jgi:Predicted lipoprotein of unknown function (DUF2380)
MAGVALFPVGAEEELAGLPVAWEEIGPNLHHVFPQAEEFALYWQHAAINIDDFMIRLPRNVHLGQIHGPGNPPVAPPTGPGGLWNTAWREFFKTYKKNQTMPTREEIFAHGRFLIEKFGLDEFEATFSSW